VRLVVADTTPLNYLVLIHHVEMLSALFEKVFVPEPVCAELRHAEVPVAVRQWITRPPPWIEIVVTADEIDDPALERLDDGERAAIQVAVRLGAELILMDDRDGVAAARSKGFAVTGTLGILDLAARRDLIRLDEALERLKATSFRCHPEIMDALLANHSAERKGGR